MNYKDTLTISLSDLIEIDLEGLNDMVDEYWMSHVDYDYWDGIPSHIEYSVSHTDGDEITIDFTFEMGRY